MVRSRSQRTRTRAETKPVRYYAQSRRTSGARSSGRRSIRRRIGTSFGRRSSSWLPTACATTSSRLASVCSAKSSASGGSGSSTNAWRAWTKSHEAGAQPAFPPSVVVEVKRSRAKSPRRHGVPLARWSIARVAARGRSRAAWSRRSAAPPCGAGSSPMRFGRGAIAVGCSRAIRTSRRKRDRFSISMPALGKASRWRRTTVVLSADEKTSIQARRRRHALVAASRRITSRRSNTSMYGWARGPTWRLGRAARQAVRSLRGPAPASPPFDRLVAQVMAQEPYRSAPRVFWIMDNGSGHRGQKAVERLQRQWPNADPGLHARSMPVGSTRSRSTFPIVQRKVLTPGGLRRSGRARSRACSTFQHRYEAAAHPFEWTFTRQDLTDAADPTRARGARPAA